MVGNVRNVTILVFSQIDTTATVTNKTKDARHSYIIHRPSASIPLLIIVVQLRAMVVVTKEDKARQEGLSSVENRRL